MAIIKCSECGRDVSDKAFSCPACGNPINTKSSGDGIAQSTVTHDAPKNASPTVAEQLVSWGLAGVFVAAGFVFNPSEAAHKAKIRAAIEAKHPVAGFLGLSRIATLDVKYESYVSVRPSHLDAGL